MTNVGSPCHALGAPGTTFEVKSVCPDKFVAYGGGAVCNVGGQAGFMKQSHIANDGTGFNNAWYTECCVVGVPGASSYGCHGFVTCNKMGPAK